MIKEKLLQEKNVLLKQKKAQIKAKYKEDQLSQLVKLIKSFNSERFVPNQTPSRS